MKTWLKAQLKKVEQIERDGEDGDEQVFYDLREIVRRTEKKAARDGYPQVVRACQIRGGGISPSIAREVLSECLSACHDDELSDADWLTAKALAAKLRISVSSLYRRINDGTIPEPTRFGRLVRWRNDGQYI